MRTLTLSRAADADTPAEELLLRVRAGRRDGSRLRALQVKDEFELAEWSDMLKSSILVRQKKAAQLCLEPAANSQARAAMIGSLYTLLPHCTAASARHLILIMRLQITSTNPAVIVAVQRARGLHDGQSFGNLDPYVKAIPVDWVRHSHY